MLIYHKATEPLGYHQLIIGRATCDHQAGISSGHSTTHNNSYIGVITPLTTTLTYITLIITPPTQQSYNTTPHLNNNNSLKSCLPLEIHISHTYMLSLHYLHRALCLDLNRDATASSGETSLTSSLPRGAS